MTKHEEESITPEARQAAWEIYERFPHACHGGSYNPGFQVPETALIIQRLLDKLTPKQEKAKQSCPVTGQNPKQLRRFKVTLRRAVLHNSDNKPQLATIVLCFTGNPSQEEVEVTESLIQLTDYAADATEEETAKWYELAERWVRDFDPHFPIVWSEEFGVEGLIQDITQWQ